MTQTVIARVPLPILEAATLCAAKKPDKTAQIDSVALSKGHVVALDTIKLFCCPIAELSKEVTVVIPLAIVKSIILQAKNNTYGLDHNSLVAEVLAIEDEMIIRVASIEVEEFFTPTGQYPQWHIAVPGKDGLDYRGPMPSFDWSELVEFQKINRILGAKDRKQVLLKPTGEDEPAHVYLIGNKFKHARGILLPLQA